MTSTVRLLRPSRPVTKAIWSVGVLLNPVSALISNGVEGLLIVRTLVGLTLWELRVVY